MKCLKRLEALEQQANDGGVFICYDIPEDATEEQQETAQKSAWNRYLLEKGDPYISKRYFVRFIEKYDLVASWSYC